AAERWEQARERPANRCRSTFPPAPPSAPQRRAEEARARRRAAERRLRRLRPRGLRGAATTPFLSPDRRKRLDHRRLWLRTLMLLLARLERTPSGADPPGLYF